MLIDTGTPYPVFEHGDALAMALEQARDTLDVLDILDGIHRSAAHLAKLCDRRSGPTRPFSREIAMCEARLRELQAERAQARTAHSVHLDLEK